ncbi:hypothetical protein SG34_030600 [Thalassomonas viridans]|uniref:Uncharacterized protein n=1 Tax=Thalassomonas viridans TaxID=137584 RepID=A0AAF0CF93_9GAMM|nr:hypothetical protein [Thalassomonas viridans]WDE09119.1 hypothetical protein SG34_030600 [Thalassomonas viridans]
MSESTPTPNEKAAAKSTPSETPDKEKASEVAEKDTAKQLKADMLQLCDDFAQFNEECAFVCDAFASIVREPETLDDPTIAGFSHYSIWLKEQVESFKERIYEAQRSLNR